MSNSRRKASKRAVEGQGAMSRPRLAKEGMKAARAPLKADGKMEVRVTCRGADLADLSDLIQIQGDLKSLSTEDFGKLKKSILKYGISAEIKFELAKLNLT